MNAIELQQQLFISIKSKIPEHISAPEEIAAMLGVSVDSAYRRMRGEKAITLDELYTLCAHYKISFDQLMNIQTGAFLFQGNLLNSQTFRFDAYLTNMMHTMAYFNSFKEKEFYYLCKDVPIFYQYHSREYSAFKYLFWMKTLVSFPEFKNKKISLEDCPKEIFELGKRNLNFYCQLDTNEIWNLESLNGTLRQIDYYVDGRMFASNEDALKVYEAIELFLDHYEKQAEIGYKFNADDPDKKPMGKLHVYLNEFILLDNNMLMVMDKSKTVLIPHTAINYITTNDITFCDNFYNYAQNLVRRSTPLSEGNEKERARFFRLLREKISNRKHALKF
jgi:hypothetical protein